MNKAGLAEVVVIEAVGWVLVFVICWQGAFTFTQRLVVVLCLAGAFIVNRIAQGTIGTNPR
jgi:hypothetical protein